MSNWEKQCTVGRTARVKDWQGEKIFRLLDHSLFLIGSIGLVSKRRGITTNDFIALNDRLVVPARPRVKIDEVNTTKRGGLEGIRDGKRRKVKEVPCCEPSAVMLIQHG